MEIRLLNRQQAHEIYNIHLKRDFPRAELKPFAAMAEYLRRGIYEPLGIYDEQNALLGYAYVTVVPGLRCGLLDYFAVLPTLRGTGIGSSILPSLAAWYAPRLEGLLIESEHPADAPDAAVAERRLAFYRRAGCRTEELETRLFGVHYQILTLPCGGRQEETNLRQQMLEIYKAMMPFPPLLKNLIFLE